MARPDVRPAGRELKVSNIDANLLKELRIEGSERELDSDRRMPRWVWPVIAAVLVLVALAGTAWWFLAARPVVVQTAAATAPGAGGAPGAVLQATGYVTARRQATVSTQITGTLTKALIEEGDHVKAGQVLAQLEDTALRAALNASPANVQAAQAQVRQLQA